LPLAGAAIFAAIRVFSLALCAFLLRHGSFAGRHWSLQHWIISWDGTFYLALAAHGYGYRWPHGHPLPAGTLYPWFPGYPDAMRLVASLPGVSLPLAGFAVTIAAGIAAGWGLTRLGLNLTANPRVSLLMVAIWASAPGSIVFSMVYTETLYCALAIWALVALTERRWLTAAGLTIAAGTVQSTASALIAAVAVAAACSVVAAIRRREPVMLSWRPAAATVLAPLGLLGYLGFVALSVGRLDGWFWIEKNAWHMSFDWGAGMLSDLGRTFLGTATVPMILLSFIIVCAAILAGWSLTERIPVYLHAYTIIGVLVAFGTTETWLCCKPRFLLPAVLLALPLARLLAAARTPVLIALVTLLATASTWCGLYLTVVARLPP